MQHVFKELNEIVDCIIKLTFDTDQNSTVFEEIINVLLLLK